VTRQINTHDTTVDGVLLYHSRIATHDVLMVIKISESTKFQSTANRR